MPNTHWARLIFPFCSNPARAAFNRAVALLPHTTYPQARQAFEQVAAIDPTCAMAHWGIAMTTLDKVSDAHPELERWP